MGVVVPSMSRRMTRMWDSSIRDTPATPPPFAAECIWVPANGFVIPLHAAARVLRRPAGLVLEQPNGANAAVSAEIEPVQRAARNANQVAGFHFYRHNWALLRVDMEQSAPGDDVADFVLIVAMLDVELCEHRIQPGSVRSDVDHIRGDVATLALELLDLLAAGAQYLIRGSIRRQVARRLPMFVVNANSGEIVAHLVVFAERTVFIGDSKDRHGNLSPGSGTAGITHSVQRRNEPTLPSGTPESQRGAWLPASPHPKYKAHAPSEENHGCRGSLAGFSKRARLIRSCPANSPESAATRGACACERPPAPSAFRILRARYHPVQRASPKGPCSKPSGCARPRRHQRRARWRDGGGLPRKAGHRRVRR